MKTNPAYVRALYIVLVPIVLLIILLNSGWLQKLLPAASINGKNYNVVAYNYYYFDYYNSFLEENEDKLDELGYDPNLSDAKQEYSTGVTWRDHLLSMGEAEMAETAYYYEQAVAANYEFSSLELAPVEETIAEIDAFRELWGLASDNYYISYYGAGMDESRFKEELTKQVKAQVYKKVLTEEWEVSEDEISAYLAEHPIADYQTANIRVITIDGLSDRKTGEYGDAQRQALTQKITELMSRYESGVSFEELQQSFSSYRLGDINGYFNNVTSAKIEATFAQELFFGDTWKNVGDYGIYISEDNSLAYFIIYEGVGASGAWQEARDAIAEEKTEEALTAAINGSYKVNRHALGMSLASR